MKWTFASWMFGTSSCCSPAPGWGCGCGCGKGVCLTVAVLRAGSILLDPGLYLANSDIDRGHDFTARSESPRSDPNQSGPWRNKNKFLKSISDFFYLHIDI